MAKIAFRVFIGISFCFIVFCAWLLDARANRTEAYARLACEASAGKDVCDNIGFYPKPTALNPKDAS